MNFLRILIIFFPVFCFASFPIKENIQLKDTSTVNQKAYEGIAVDSTSKYPLQKETLTEYRKRLKKQLYASSTSEVKTSLITKVLFILILVIVVIMMIVLASSSSDPSTRGSSGSINLNDILDDCCGP